MAEGLNKTFEVLATTPNEASVDVLVVGLDSPDEGKRDAALSALLRRRSTPGHLAILARLHEHGGPWREPLLKQRGRMIAALRNAVVGADVQLFDNACQVILWLGEFDLVPALVTAAQDRSHGNAFRAAATINRILQRLSKMFTTKDPLVRRDPHAIRRQMVSSLEPAVRRFDDHGSVELVEAFLRLASYENTTLRAILLNPRDPAHHAVVDSLTGSPAPEIMHLLLSFLSDSRAPDPAISAVAKREDLGFVVALLESVSESISASTRRNLARIDRFVWLSDNASTLDALDGESKARVPVLVNATNVPHAEKLKLLERLLVSDAIPARRAACKALDHLEEEDANRLVMKALSDDDPDVQASAAQQLRRRNVPGAMAQLVRLLDSPHQIVRRAAQDSLEEFRFDKYLASFDLMDDTIRQSTGELVAKTDSSAREGLHRELSANVRTRRLRAIHVAEAMGMVEDVSQQLIEMLSDNDHFVRAEATRALGGCHTRASKAALVQALADPSVTVRETAKESIHALRLG